MQYRNYGKTGVKVSALAFGAMRLPMTEGRIDRNQSLPLIHRAIELGVNYLDTGKWYCNQDSERFIGEAIKGFDRSRLYLSTKYAQEHPTAADLREKFEASLKLMDLDYIDFYHLWGLSWEQFETKMACKGGPLEAFLKLKEEGRVKHLSFSFHSKPEDMKRLIDTGYFETVLCQYNLLDRANEEAIAYAASKGLGVAIMGPVGGGRLGWPADSLSKMLDARKPVSTPEIALRFVLANRNVSMALSGMGAMQQVEENVAVASNESYLSTGEAQTITQAMNENRKFADLYCTGCGYCMPCPNKVDISRVFQLANYERVYGMKQVAHSEYKPLTEGAHWSKNKGAESCTECGQCEPKCPQKIKIMSQLKQAHEMLTKDDGWKK